MNLKNLLVYIFLLCAGISSVIAVENDPDCTNICPDRKTCCTKTQCCLKIKVNGHYHCRNLDSSGSDFFSDSGSNECITPEPDIDTTPTPDLNTPTDPDTTTAPNTITEPNPNLIQDPYIPNYVNYNNNGYNNDYDGYNNGNNNVYSDGYNNNYKNDYNGYNYGYNNEYYNYNNGFNNDGYY